LKGGVALAWPYLYGMLVLTQKNKQKKQTRCL